MSTERVIRVVVEDGDVEKFKKSLKETGYELNDVDKKVKKVSKSTKDEFRGSQAAADRLSGGVGGVGEQLVVVAKAAKKGGAAMKSAMVATGVGALIVALGFIVDNWEEISNAITGANKELEKQKRLTSEINSELERRALLNKDALRLQRQQEEEDVLRAKIRGASEKEITAIRRKGFEDRIKIAQQEAEEANKILTKSTGADKEAYEAAVKAQQEAFSRLGSERAALSRFDLEQELILVEKRRKEEPEEQVDRPRNLETLQTQKATEVQIFSDAEKLKTQAVVDSLIEQERLRKEAAAQERRIAQAEAEYKIQTAANVLGALQGLAEQGSAGAKAIAVAQAVVSTYQGINKALAETTDFTPTQSLRFLNAALVGVAGFANVAKILSTDSSGATVPTGIGGGGAGSQPQAPSFNVVGQSGVNQLADTLNQEQQPIQAFVVGSQVTTQQELDNNIVNTANIG